MQNLTRLTKLAMVSKEVSEAVTWLMNHDGLCTCGRWLAGMDSKFILANIGPHDSHEPKRRDMAVIAAYCFDCYNNINDALKRCKDACYKQKRPESELRG